MEVLERMGFIKFAVECGAIQLLKKPTFTLKSGRKSPYFFNSGAFSTGYKMWSLCQAYANMLCNSRFKFDSLFGPAYKGSSLASVTAALLTDYDMDVGFASNRKEAKDHGEGGDLIGISLKKKRTVIIDDVITDGQAKDDAYRFICAHGGKPVGIAIAFDRQERGITTELSASQEIKHKLGIPIISIACAEDLLLYLLREQEQYPQEFAALTRYQAEYGVA